MKLLVTMCAFALVVAACGGSETTAQTDATQSTEPSTASDSSTTTTEAATTTAEATTTTAEATTTTQAATTTTEAPELALTQDGDTYTIVWASTTNPFFLPDSGSNADPLIHIHTDPDVDGFFFSLEMYTTGYGALWTGELGDVEVLCMEGLPGANSTGICPYFDPDGSGPIEVSSAFVATGSITINRLDDSGYDITINEIVYPDGTTIASFQMTGS